MDLSLLLEMVASGVPDRVVLGSLEDGLTATQLRRRAVNGSAVIRASGAGHVVFVATSDEVFPIALFAASMAGVPFVPLNYRLATEQLVDLVSENQPAYVIAESAILEVLGVDSDRSATPEQWLELTRHDPDATSDPAINDPDSVAVLLYTSGTTAAPKAAVLRHRHLTSYVLAAVDFASADPDDCSLVAVPPYHIAGVANTITNLYAGRRVVHLSHFSPDDWLACVTREQVTQALVVPTMLARIVAHAERLGSLPPNNLRSLAYGGAPMPAAVIEQALALFPDTDFVNAYGLTETTRRSQSSDLRSTERR